MQFAFSIEATRARFRFHTLDVEVDTDRRNSPTDLADLERMIIELTYDIQFAL